MDKWKIWFKRFNAQGRCYAGGVAIEEYIHKSSAVRAAKKRYGTDFTKCEWIVSQTNPWSMKEECDRDKVINYLMNNIS